MLQSYLGVRRNWSTEDLQVLVGVVNEIGLTHTDQIVERASALLERPEGGVRLKLKKLQWIPDGEKLTLRILPRRSLDN